MSKLYRARSLLYRRQILQETIRWKALDEIYKICMLLHRSDLNISAKCPDADGARPLWRLGAGFRRRRETYRFVIRSLQICSLQH